ncbi:MAG: YidC/Oxa1 family membrane protein insertase [Clostridia bacterium]|nr:YidC/Oxa1 family membrane protein insertase [Clostridia bacterium]
MFNFIYQFIGSIIRFFYDLFGDYTIALFFFTLIFQIALLPLGIKQQKNQVKQASLQPKIMAIRKKYAGRNDQATQQKMQQETMDLYQRENFNPAGGCLPLFIQLPIIMLLYNVVRAPLSYILKYSAESIEAIKGIVEAAGYTINAAYAELDIAHYMTVMGEGEFAHLNLGMFPDFKLFGMDLTQIPVEGGKVVDWRLLIIPAVTFIAMYGSQFIIRKFSYQSPEVKEQQKSCSMKIMNISMPLMSVYFAAIWPGTLGVYWILRNILQTIQQIIMAKAIPVPVFTEEDFKAAERELAGKKKKGDKKANAEIDPNRPKVRSLHYIDADDEDYPVLPDKEEKSEVSNAPAPKAEESVDVNNGEAAAETTSANAEDPAKSSDIVSPAPMKDEGDKPKK